MLYSSLKNHQNRQKFGKDMKESLVQFAFNHYSMEISKPKITNAYRMETDGSPCRVVMISLTLSKAFFPSWEPTLQGALVQIRLIRLHS